MLGGLIVDHLSWRWIFLINIPIGVVSLVTGLRQLPPRRPTRQSFDFGGLALLGPGLALLVYGLSRAGAAGTFAAAPAGWTMAGGMALLALFVGHARRRGERALIPLAYFRDRVFAATGLATFVIGIAVVGVMLLLPLYFQHLRGRTRCTLGCCSPRRDRAPPW